MKNCYNCGKELSNIEVVKSYIKCKEERGGNAWTGCRDIVNMFVQEEDNEIKERYNEAGGEVKEIVRSVVVCEDCVKLIADTFEI